MEQEGDHEISLQFFCLSFRMSSCLVITKALRKPNYLDARIIVRSVGTADTLCSSANSKTGSKELSKVDCYDVCGECVWLISDL